MKLAEFTTEELCAEITRRMESEQIAAAITATAEHYNIPPSSMLGRYPGRNAAKPRMAAAYIASRNTTLKSADLAKAFGLGDASTMRWSLNRAKLYRSTDPDFLKFTDKHTNQ